VSAPGAAITGTDAWGPPDARGLTIAVDDAPARQQPDSLRRRVDELWARACAENPRMFDGPLLAVDSFDPARGRMSCRRDTFRHIIARPSVDTGVELLAVSAVVVARDRAGREHAFIGRRGVQTRIYGGLWELGPSGGITPPAQGVREIGMEGVLAQLDAEMGEEAGLSIAGAETSIAGFVRDHIAFSLDILVSVRPSEAIEELAQRGASHTWEYAESHWIPVDEIGAFDREHAAEIIAPTRAAFRLLGWVM
jgi:hypothetical protein